MKEFLMIFRHEQNENVETPSVEQMAAVMKQWQTWIKEIAAKGKYSSTNRLFSEGKTLKTNNLIIDGPYAEAKEIVGGYLITKADSLDDAVEMAKSCPNLLYGGTVEVRNVMPIEYDTNSKNFLDVK